MNTENQTDLKPHADILEDLKNDFAQPETSSQSIQTQLTVEVIPSFLPLPLVKLSVVGKNAAIVTYLSKNLPDKSKALLKDHYKPTDEEVNLYARFLESVVWKNFPQVAQWFLSNKGASLAGEILLFESVRAAPILTLVAEKQKDENKPEVQNA